jgi:antitoxin YefM
MRAISHTEANNLAEMIEQVVNDHTPIIITGTQKKAAVLISLEDYNAWQETLYLMRSPANAERLQKALADYKENKNFHAHDLIED